MPKPAVASAPIPNGNGLPCHPGYHARSPWLVLSDHLPANDLDATGPSAHNGMGSMNQIIAATLESKPSTSLEARHVTPCDAC